MREHATQQPVASTALLCTLTITCLSHLSKTDQATAVVRTRLGALLDSPRAVRRIETIRLAATVVVQATANPRSRVMFSTVRQAWEGSRCIVVLRRYPQAVPAHTLADTWT